MCLKTYSSHSQGTRTASSASHVWTRWAWFYTGRCAPTRPLNFRVCLNTNSVCLLQDGTLNVASGHLIRITTTATCSTTCPWGRGRRPGLTALTRAVTSSASLIPLNRPSYKVVPSSPQFTLFKHSSSFCEQQLGCFTSCLCSYYKNIWLTIIRTTLKWAEPGSLCKTQAEVRFMLFNTRGRQRLFS